MNSLLWQVLTIIAIAVVVFEARRWAARGLSRIGASFGRARARRGKAASRTQPATVGRPSPAASLTATVPLAPMSAIPRGPFTAAERSSPPRPDETRGRIRPGWLALAVLGAVAAIIVVMILHSRRQTAARAREAP